MPTPDELRGNLVRRMRNAFVSHSTSDDRYVAEMESFLRAAGYEEVFNDVSAIRPDEKFWPEIEKGIAKCEALVVVITSASNASEWVKREVEYARGLSKKIIPVWIEDCPIPPIFADRDVIDFRPRAGQERRFEISRIDKYAPAELIGRERETKLLNDAWEKVLRIEKGRSHVLTIVALGGEGKTSLVAKWAAELAHQDWPGCDAAFAWSFYSQGTREQMAASSDLFLKEALAFFGDETDKAFAAGNAGAYEKGQRLARLVGQRRSLLILDGLEPLQYAPTSPTPGQLKDQGIAALLKGLAANSHGLCVVTTRYSLPDLKAFWQTTAPEVKLLRLSRAAGVHLLQSFGVKGSLLRNIPFQGVELNEFEKLVEDVQGHALTLQLLGTYLRDAHAGDIRKRDLVKLEEADAEEQGGHAFRVMEAYVKWFQSDGEKGHRALAVLRCLGLFDRPATADCFAALLKAPAISGMTKPLVGISEAQTNLTFSRLEAAKLLTVNRDAVGSLISLDTHPILRGYFASERRAQHREAWRLAQQQLFEYLCGTTDEGNQPTFEALQPLYQAVYHGCRAGMPLEALLVLDRRIGRFHEKYAVRKFGAFGDELGAVACFFDEPWTVPSPLIPVTQQAWILGYAGSCLSALARLNEAIVPMLAALKIVVGQKNWKYAATLSSNANDVKLTLGEVANALTNSQHSRAYADQSGDVFLQIATRVRRAAILHQAGQSTEAKEHFGEAELLQAAHQPEYPQLYGLAGFWFCDLLLHRVEREAWNLSYSGDLQRPESVVSPQSLRDVAERATQGLIWAEAQKPLAAVEVGINHLTLGRACLYRTLFDKAFNGTAVKGRRAFNDCTQNLDVAVAELRRANTRDEFTGALLSRAWLRFLAGACIGPESAQSDLDEAWEIAERGPMLLHMADIHLYRARLFGRPNDECRMTKYPWESPQADLAAAEKLIDACGYHRRDEELADAKAAILLR